MGLLAWTDCVLAVETTVQSNILSLKLSVLLAVQPGSVQAFSSSWPWITMTYTLA